MVQVKTAVFLADGFEEVEAITPIDYLRRAGIDVILAGIGTTTPTGSEGVKIVADMEVSNLPDNLDAVVLPGGMPGAANLAASSAVENLCRKLFTRGNLVAAICASPALALGQFGLLNQRRFTCYPGFEKDVRDGDFLTDRVVVDGNLITSRGPGTAGEFAVEIVRYLVNNETAEKIKKSVLL